MIHRLPIKNLTIDDVISASNPGHKILLSGAGSSKVRAGEKAVFALVSDNKKPVYGVNTGVGNLCDTALPSSHFVEFQRNLILSHACGSGPFLEEKISRGAFFLLINSLAKGFSGMSEHTLKKLILLFNDGVSPMFPAQGSLGASGDLIPLAHLGLLVLGKGNAYRGGKIESAAKILKRLNAENHQFKPKDALSIINGTAVSAINAAFVVYGAEKLILTSLRPEAALFEIMGISRSAIAPELNDLKPYPGQIFVAKTFRNLLSGTKLCERVMKKVQGPYVIRCAPQIDGAILDAIEQAKKTVEIEINSVTDNPLFFSRNGKASALSGGNFHAQSIAFAMDNLGIALTAFSKVTERRIERLLNGSLSGLPAFLAPESGLHSGLMMVQYLAASLVAENSVLAHPASIQSIPVSAHQEDFVSMSMTAAEKGLSILRNSERILAVFILVAVQGIDLALKINNFEMADFSRETGKFYKKIRNHIPAIHRDRWLSPDIDKITQMVRDQELAI